MDFWKHNTEWFAPLNPYETKGSLLKVEDQNYRLDKDQLTKEFWPLYCFAVSAKRYALFNIDGQGRPIIRKASAHGLGHLLRPYDETAAPAAIPSPIVLLNEIGRWEHDVWYRIVEAALVGRPDQPDYSDLPNFDHPGVIRYTATNPALLDWFGKANNGKPYVAQVRPFNFLYLFMARHLSERPDGCRMGVGRAADSACQARRAAAGSDVREVLNAHLLCALDRLPMEGVAEGPAAEEHGA